MGWRWCEHEPEWPLLEMLPVTANHTHEAESETIEAEQDPLLDDVGEPLY